MNEKTPARIKPAATKIIWRSIENEAGKLLRSRPTSRRRIDHQKPEERQEDGRSYQDPVRRAPAVGDGLGCQGERAKSSVGGRSSTMGVGLSHQVLHDVAGRGRHPSSTLPPR